MITRALTTIILFLLVFQFSCGEKAIVTDPERPVLFWSPPEDFKPSYITEDNNGVFWGLFISKRYSAKYNLWVVKSKDSENWTDPLLVDNAYYFSDLNFNVRNDSLNFIFYEIAPEYFRDHGQGIGEFVDNKDDLELTFVLKDLRYDRDRDGIPDKIEKELLTSNRLLDTDLDGKSDRLDFNPLSMPQIQTVKHKLYKSVIQEILKTSKIDNTIIKKDSVWSRFFGIYVISEPNPLYLSFQNEKSTFELTGFDVPLIIVRTPLWFGSRPSYRGWSDGIIPHLNFTEVSIDILRKNARVRVQNYISHENSDEFNVFLKKKDDSWQVESIILIEEEILEEDTTEVEDS
jgi:hypothetical protein